MLCAIKRNGIIHDNFTGPQGLPLPLSGLRFVPVLVLLHLSV